MKPEQQSLFELEPAAWELDDSAEQFVATVVFSGGPQQPFDYCVPDELRGKLTAGQRVRAPFGPGDRPRMGYCVRLDQRIVPRRLKPVLSLVDERPLLGPAMLRLSEWMAEYYLCPWGQVLEAVVPAGVRGRAGTRETRFVWLPNRVAARLSGLRLPPKQSRILSYLSGRREAMPVAQLAAAAGCTMAPIRALEKKGLLEFEIRRFDAGAAAGAPVTAAAPGLKLNADQQRALDAIRGALHSQDHRTVLVHGITGSGKTEVYMQAITEVVSFGRQAIVLVPEISLIFSLTNKN